MANHAMTPTELGVNSGTIDPTATSFSAADTGSVANAVPEQLLLRVVNSTTAGNFVVDAGDYPPALASGQGDLTVAMEASKTYTIGPFESGRFIQSDGSLTFSSAVAATVMAFTVARH